MNAPRDSSDRRYSRDAVDSHHRREGTFGRAENLQGRRRPRQDQLDWPAMKSRIDLTRVVTGLLGHARKTGGSGRQWWLCPFHSDRNPSFCVTPGRSEWRCFGCGARGDAAALLMKIQNVTFPQAVRRLASEWGIGHPRVASGEWRPSGKCDPGAPPSAGIRQARPVTRLASPVTPQGLDRADAMALVTRGQERLWSPEGLPFRRALHLRGLTGETIRAARLGWTPGVTIPSRSEIRCFRASGLIVPWFDGDRLAMVKIRQPANRKPKYIEAFRDGPRVYPSLEMVRPGAPLILVEGELDALLLGQELGERAAVVTLGSASSRPDPDVRWTFLAALPIFAAHDADPAGDRAATSWDPQAVRARPPEPDKDWTDVHRRGRERIRGYWNDRLTPTTEIPDEHDRQERAAILEFDAGLTREAAERAAGILVEGETIR